jgi:hypothetical protein
MKHRRGYHLPATESDRCELLGTGSSSAFHGPDVLSWSRCCPAFARTPMPGSRNFKQITKRRRLSQPTRPTHRTAVPNFVPNAQINWADPVAVNDLSRNVRAPCARGTLTLWNVTERYLRFFVISAWGACGRRFKSGRPDQSKTRRNKAFSVLPFDNRLDFEAFTVGGFCGYPYKPAFDLSPVPPFRCFARSTVTTGF